MAHVTKTIPKQQRPGRPASAAITRYFDGQTWKLEQGRDFHGEPRSYATSMRYAAKTRGLRAVVAIRGTHIYITARKKAS